MAEESRGGHVQDESQAAGNNAAQGGEPTAAEASVVTAAAGEAAGCFRLNVHAPEFVPQSQVISAASPFATVCYPYVHLIDNEYIAAAASGAMGQEQWIYLADREPIPFMPDLAGKAPGNSTKGGSDVTQKIVKQVEYQFSDTNLVANDFLMKIMNKDPEGYVPMSVVASWKKIKALGANNYLLVKALRTSTKLVVSEDGKKIKRKQVFTDRNKEELQSRTVMVENLPEDYSRQSLEKLFSVAGSVKNIRICHPQEPSSTKSLKTEVLISNKVHALVEFETTDQAEKAVEKLNDERNWRKGLRVRTMIRCSPKSVIRSKKADYDHFDMYAEDDQAPSSQTSARLDQLPLEQHNAEDNQGGARKPWGRGRGKTLAPVQTQIGRGLLTPASQAIGASEASSKQGVSSHGPRMPDGTRGFTMGRGKPLGAVLGRAPSPALTPVQM